VLVWLLAPGQLALDRFVNLCLLVLAGVTLYRAVRLARRSLLWRVSRKLILSYILVGAVPILLLATFSVLAFLLIFFDVSAYLVQSRVAALASEASAIARLTEFELQRVPEARYAGVAERRRRAAAAEYRSVSVAIVSVDALPEWLRTQPYFSGLISKEGAVNAAAVVQVGDAGSHGVVVEIPVQEAVGASELGAAGIQLGARRLPYALATATFLTHHDWQTGKPSRVPVAMSVNVSTLYRFLGRDQDAANAATFNQLLLFALFLIGALFLVIEMVALGSGVGLARSITAAVDELFAGTERVKAGEFGRPIAVRSNDQLGHLSVSFNEMTGRIEALLREQDEQRRLAEELRIARDIQMSLLPQGPLSGSGLSVAALCAPAREVGGDYYDFLPLPDGRLALLIADVSGKGMSAALYMAELKGLMLSLSRIHASPRALLIEANGIIAHHLDSRSFITMTYAVYDPVSRTLTCARAGHCPFIRIPASQRAEVVTPDGMVLGLNLDRGERFERCLEEITVGVEPGDLFFFFTDGVTEAMDAGGELFGEMRVADVLERYAAQHPEAIRDAMVRGIADFANGQPQHDDITMIILKADG
jgi:serine phosphatase RsbU (regulator of sigma subunit)